MNNIKILVDSGSDLSLEYCKKYDITIVPLNLQIEGVLFQMTVILMPPNTVNI